MLEEMMLMAQGNPGAINCLIGMIQGDIENSVAGITIIPKLKETNITRTDIYVLFSDICNKDYQKMAKLCKSCPNDILIDAASRQDFSGRELVQDYI